MEEPKQMGRYHQALPGLASFERTSEYKTPKQKLFPDQSALGPARMSLQGSSFKHAQGILTPHHGVFFGANSTIAEMTGPSTPARLWVRASNSFFPTSRVQFVRSPERGFHEPPFRRMR